MRAAWRWRARQAALKAGQGAASGLVASAAHGNEVRPRSAARQGTAGPFGRHGGEAARRRALVAACASTGRARQRVACALKWGGASAARRGSTAGQRGGSEAARQRRSERTRAQVPARARRAEQRGEREKEWREERKNVNGLTQSKLTIFN